MHTIKKLFGYITILIFLTLFCGCGGLTDQGVQFVTIPDTSPSKLDVSISVGIGGNTAAQNDDTEVYIRLNSKAAQLVRFDKGETLTCNGTRKLLESIGFDETYSTAKIAGTLFNCTYTSGQTTAIIQFTIPEAPHILAPLPNSTVARSTQTPVQFHVGAGTVTGIVALGNQSKAGAQVQQSDMVTLDTSHFAAGPGSIVLTQSLNNAPVSATGFASVRMYGNAIATVNVIWG